MVSIRVYPERIELAARDAVVARIVENHRAALGRHFFLHSPWESALHNYGIRLVGSRAKNYCCITFADRTLNC
jgi:hypothetical protein